LKNTEKIKRPNVIKTFIKLLPMTFTVAPLLFILTQLFGIMMGISYGVIAIFTRKFFDSATMFADKKVTLSVVVISLVTLGIIHLIKQIINGFAIYYPPVFAGKAGGKLSQMIHIKMSKLSAVGFEDTNTLDDINKAEQGSLMI